MNYERECGWSHWPVLRRVDAVDELGQLDVALREPVDVVTAERDVDLKGKDWIS